MSNSKPNGQIAKTIQQIDELRASIRLLQCTSAVLLPDKDNMIDDLHIQVLKAQTRLEKLLEVDQPAIP